MAGVYRHPPPVPPRQSLAPRLNTAIFGGPRNTSLALQATGAQNSTVALATAYPLPGASTAPAATLLRSDTRALSAVPAAPIATMARGQARALPSVPAAPVASLARRPNRPLPSVPPAPVARRVNTVLLARPLTQAPLATNTPVGAHAVRQVSALGQTSPLAAIRRGITHSIAGASLPLSSLSRQGVKSLAAPTTAPLASLTKPLGRTLTKTTAPAGTLAAVKSLARALQATTAAVATRQIGWQTALAAFTSPSATLARRLGRLVRGTAQALATAVATRIGFQSGTVHLVGIVLVVPAEAPPLTLASESIRLVLSLDSEAAPMALLHPVSIDPAEQIYLRIDAAPLISAASETITAATFTPSSQATLDSHTLVDSFYDPANRAIAFKPTGGVAGTQYAWTLSFNTTDVDSRNQRRKRTIMVSVVTK